MRNMPAIFSSSSSQELSMDALLSIYKDLKCDKVIFKRLASNDNSKNQLYFGSHLTDLSFLPIGEVGASDSTSGKKNYRDKGPKFTAHFPFLWIDAGGKEYPAPNSKLIYYPQYPEVRFSGFVQSCAIDADGWLDPKKLGRMAGRILILGISKSRKSTFGFFATPESQIAKEIKEKPATEARNLFETIWDDQKYEEGKSFRELLLESLAQIHLENWIPSQRMNADGKIVPYTAQNGGGYTLEAKLGIIPNGFAEPDYLGWEIKQFQVANFLKAFQGKALTLLTPEPTGGYYVEKGVPEFLRKYGMLNKNTPDRYDFCGRHFATGVCPATGLNLAIEGFDEASRKVSDSKGAIHLIDYHGNDAASWNFTKIIEHWNKKHANAVYVPSMKRQDLSLIHYRYSNLVRLYTGTNINLFLNSVLTGAVYYDPGIKLENSSTRPVTKRRSQFRVKAKELDTLYVHREDVDLMEYVQGC